ncbi:MAG: hypothetical protein Q9169_003818 [Polycauliona sp. 2 TL-2023]
MQTLWARVAQTPCCCKNASSFSSAAAVARRTSTAPIRRRLGADDVFAAFFSTVAFASAVADGNRKDAKKEEWTRVIRDARRELASLKAEQRRRISNIAAAAPFEPTPPHEEIIVPLQREWEDAFEWGDKEMRDRRALGLEDWQGIPMEVLRKASQDEIKNCLNHHIHHFPKFRGAQGSDVWNTATWTYHIKKNKTLEWSIAHLALDLMSHVPEDQPETSCNAEETTKEVMSQLTMSGINDIDSKRDYIKDRLRDLSRRNAKEVGDEYFHRFESPELPRYSLSQDDDADCAHQLNAKLHSLFDQPTAAEARQMNYILPRICYYLLTSNASPSIHTYNLLISEFAGQRRDDLISHLIRSMNRTHVRPNEITLAETLRHYVRTNDRFRFDRFIQRMEGLDQGLGEAHPQIDVPDILKFQYRVRVFSLSPNRWSTLRYQELSDLDESGLQGLKEQSRVKVYEKSRRNPEVYQALIQGALFFGEPLEAVRGYRAMLSEGWEPDQEIHLSILHHCRVDQDWAAGLVVWRRLQMLDEPIDERGFLLMLQLCQKCNKHEHTVNILQYGISKGVLPSTVLEMGWPHFKAHQDANDIPDSLDEAKSIEKLKEGLRVLIPRSRAKFSGQRVDLDRMRSMADHIRRSLVRPSFGTAALLHQARVRIALLEKAHLRIAENHRLHEFDAILGVSNRQISGLVSELRDLQFSINLREIESIVPTKLSTIANWLEDSKKTVKDTMYSLAVMDLEDRVTTIGLYIRKSQTRLVTLQRETLSKHFHKLWLQATDLHYQMKEIHSAVFQHVIDYFVELIKKQEAQMSFVSQQIRATSMEIESLLGTKDKKVLHARNIELFGACGEFCGPRKFRLRYHGGGPPKGVQRAGGSDSKTGTSNIPTEGSKSKSSRAEAARSANSKAQPVDQSQRQLDMQKAPVRTDGQFVGQRRLDLRDRREPFKPDPGITTADYEIGVRAGQGWRQPPLGMSVIGSLPEPVSVYQMEHG